MEITCLQMDVLISFYIEGDLSSSLKEKVEEHLKNCPTCRAKYNIINSLFADVKKSLSQKETEVYTTNAHPSKQYVLFKNNLSAYVDNELSQEENIKMKKFTINNKQARKELENAYHIRKLMKDSYRKTKMNAKPDFSRKILKKLNPDDKNSLSFNPLIKIGFAFIMTVLIISSIIIYLLSFA